MEKPLIALRPKARKTIGEIKLLSNENGQHNNPNRKVSRREFLKYSAGVAAVAAGTAAMMGKIPLPQSTSRPTGTAHTSSDMVVVTVRGDELNLISADKSVKVKDPDLAAQLAGRAQAED